MHWLEGSFSSRRSSEREPCRAQWNLSEISAPPKGRYPREGHREHGVRGDAAAGGEVVLVGGPLRPQRGLPVQDVHGHRRAEPRPGLRGHQLHALRHPGDQKQLCFALLRFALLCFALLCFPPSARR